MSRLEMVEKQLRDARRYSLRLLEDLHSEDWFRMPQPAVTHIGWQVGHLAVAEYWLAIKRIRGDNPDQTELIPESLLQQFGRTSSPLPDPEKYPRPAELLDLLAKVHEEALAVVRSLSDSELDQPASKPHPLFTTKLGALVWCGQHEMVHAGQIGLLRRLLGRKPQW